MRNIEVLSVIELNEKDLKNINGGYVARLAKGAIAFAYWCWNNQSDIRDGFNDGRK